VSCFDKFDKVYKWSSLVAIVIITSVFVQDDRENCLKVSFETRTVFRWTIRLYPVTFFFAKLLTLFERFEDSLFVRDKRQVTGQILLVFPFEIGHPRK